MGRPVGEPRTWQIWYNFNVTFYFTANHNIFSARWRALPFHLWRTSCQGASQTKFYGGPTLERNNFKNSNKLAAFDFWRPERYIWRHGNWISWCWRGRWQQYFFSWPGLIFVFCWSDKGRCMSGGLCNVHTLEDTHPKIICLQIYRATRVYVRGLFHRMLLKPWEPDDLNKSPWILTELKFTIGKVECKKCAPGTGLVAKWLKMCRRMPKEVLHVRKPEIKPLAVDNICDKN